jgi:hypothetical protein
MRLAFAAALAVTWLAGCGHDQVTEATPASPRVYTATLTASSSCARHLPPGLAVRTYQAAAFPDGHLHWIGPTVTEPQGSHQFSSWKVDGDSVSLTIGEQPEDRWDEFVFHGIWEDLGGGHQLTIYGRGTGRVEGSAMTGTFEGDFTSWYTAGGGTDCTAADHHFTLTPLQSNVDNE